MTIYDMAQSPTSVSMSLRANTAQYVSPLIGSVQTIDRGGMKWIISYTFTNVSRDKRRELMGIVARLRGQVHRLRVPVVDNPKGGGYGGTPLVNGGSQTGSTLNIDGLTNKTNWIRAGDYFSVDVNGEHELKMCTADANSAAGAITGLQFEPRLRASPLNNAAIFVGDGGSVPVGIFYLSDPTIGWSSRPASQISEVSSISINMTEDVFATQ